MNTRKHGIPTEESARASTSAAGPNKAKISAIWEQMNAKSKSLLGQNLTRVTQSGAGSESKVSEQLAAAAKAAAALVKEGRTEAKVAKISDLNSKAAENKEKISDVDSKAAENRAKISDLDTKAAEAAEKKAKMVASSSRGLDALLQQISKKPKISILDKSRQDWGQFKHAEGFADELEAYKKSGDKYLDKVAFLQRADVREYERERDIRLAMQAKRRTDSTCRE